MNKTTAFSDDLALTFEPNGPLHILVVGRKTTTEFQAIVRFLGSLNSKNTRTFYLESIATDTEGNPQRKLLPDLMIVLQSHPDEFGKYEIESLISRNPLARLVCCFGSWCESLQRTRDAWPESCVVPIHSAIRRIVKELRVLDSKETPLPLTATRVEAFEYCGSVLNSCWNSQE